MGWIFQRETGPLNADYRLNMSVEIQHYNCLLIKYDFRCFLSNFLIFRIFVFVFNITVSRLGMLHVMKNTNYQKQYEIYLNHLLNYEISLSPLDTRSQIKDANKLAPPVHDFVRLK